MHNRKETQMISQIMKIMDIGHVKTSLKSWSKTILQSQRLNKTDGYLFIFVYLKVSEITFDWAFDVFTQLSGCPS